MITMMTIFLWMMTTMMILNSLDFTKKFWNNGHMKKILMLLLLIWTGCAQAQTIAEKKAGLTQPSGMGDLSPAMRKALAQVNQDLEALDKELHQLYGEAQCLYNRRAAPCDYQQLLYRINEIKQKRNQIEAHWRELATQEQLEGYALWHQPSTTLEQLVMDYGAQDYVYLIPPDIAEVPLSVNSNLPIPRAAWNEMLETILAQNGIGIRQLNPFLRELFWIKEDRSHLRLITNRREDLAPLRANDRVGFMVSPEPSDVRRIWFFLEKFVNPHSVVLQQVGRDILIVAQVSEMQEILKLYDFVVVNRGEKEYKLIPIERVDAAEIAKILNAIFGVLTEEPAQLPSQPVVPPFKQLARPQNLTEPALRSRQPLAPKSPNTNLLDNGLQVIPLTEVAQAVFLIGTRAEIRKAESIIREVEDQVGEVRGKVIYWYTTKHSNPENLADILARIYDLMISQTVEDTDGDNTSSQNNVNQAVRETVNITQRPALPPPPPRRPYEQGFFLDDSYVVNRMPPPLLPVANQNRDNFIVDLKTGAIVMVVEAGILPKMKELIKKLDVPKKMVQLEVLLFEKRLNRETNFGLNLLKIGSAASDTNQTSAVFNLPRKRGPAGIFDFIISRAETCSGVPAFDAVYRFLLSQEDVYIHANPSVLAVNQTPAVIEIDEEISVNTGIYAVDTVGGVTLENAFARARYGIKIEITPTIHTQEEEPCPDELPYVSMLTNITFQTFKPSRDNRPDVTTRHVVNEVRIPDGQTVILGGLRQRNSRDKVDKIPFLGDIPGVGKLFSLTELRDDTTEMFIFLTPRIVYDPGEDLERIKLREMCLRPGDIPEFLCILSCAEEWESERLFQSTLTMLLGRMPDRGVGPPGEYDGR